jgi:hypothetical protein
VRRPEDIMIIVIAILYTLGVGAFGGSTSRTVFFWPTTTVPYGAPSSKHSFGRSSWQWN